MDEERQRAQLVTWAVYLGVVTVLLAVASVALLVIVWAWRAIL